MNKQEVIKAFCEINLLAYHSMQDYSLAADCFCGEQATAFVNDFRFDGFTIDYIRKAVVDKLKADGFKIDSGFNVKTGKPKASIASPLDNLIATPRRR